MIPKPFIAMWQEHAPWSTFAQVEQDLTFTSDMEGLLRPGITYDHKQAFTWLKKEVISKI